MSPTAAGLLCGAAGGTGLALAVAVARGFEVRPARPPSAAGRVLAGVLASRRRVTAALVVAVVLAVVTRWPVAALAGAVLVVCWPLLFSGRREAAAAIARLEALTIWTESLRDTIAGAGGLEQAIPATVATAPAVIRPQLENLAARLRSREPLPAALGRLASDLADGSADVVCAALILGARLRGPGLVDTLTAVAVSSREELDLRRRVEAQRRAVRRNVTVVLAIFAGMAVLLFTANRPFLAPYGSILGQLVLALIAAGLAGCLVALSRLARADDPDRFLVAPAESGGVDGGRA